jgi:hypothetical protein
MDSDEINTVRSGEDNLPDGKGGGVGERKRLRIEAQENVGATPRSRDSTRLRGAQPRDIM